MERDIKEYIVKLNDRNIQRQRESGFTLYAIGAIIIYILFYLIDNIGIAKLIVKNSSAFNIATITTNLCLSVSYFFLGYLLSIRTVRITKIFPFQKPLSRDFSDFLIFTFLFISAIINFIGLQQYQNYPHAIFQSTFLFLAIANILVPPILRYYIEWEKDRKDYTIESIDFTYFNVSTSKKMSVWLVVIFMLLTILTLYTCTTLNFKIDSNSALVIKYTLHFFGLLICLKIASSIKEKIENNSHLEDFEMEIYFENLSNEKIIEIYEADFNGMPIKRWISKKDTEIEEFFETKKKEFLAQNVRINDLVQRENTTSNDYTYIFYDVVKNQSVILENAKEFVKRLDNVFKDISNYSSITSEETESLTGIQVSLNEKIKNFNNEYSHISRRIKRDIVR